MNLEVLRLKWAIAALVLLKFQQAQTQVEVITNPDHVSVAVVDFEVGELDENSDFGGKTMNFHGGGRPHGN